MEIGNEESPFALTCWCRICYITKYKIVQIDYLQYENICYFCSTKLEGRPISCRLSDKVRCSNRVTIILCCLEEIVSSNLYDYIYKICHDLDSNRYLYVMQANGQLRKWFEDDDALESAINGEYVSD